MIYDLEHCYFCKQKLQPYKLAGLWQDSCRNKDCNHYYRVTKPRGCGKVISFTYKNNYFGVYYHKQQVHVNSCDTKRRHYTFIDRLVTPEHAVMLRMFD